MQSGKYKNNIDIGKGVANIVRQLLSHTIEEKKSDICMIHPTRLSILRLISYCTIGLLCCRLKGSIKFPRQNGLVGKLFRSDDTAIVNRSNIGYKMYPLEKRVSRQKILALVSTSKKMHQTRSVFKDSSEAKIEWL